MPWCWLCVQNYSRPYRLTYICSPGKIRPIIQWFPAGGVSQYWTHLSVTPSVTESFTVQLGEWNVSAFREILSRSKSSPLKQIKLLHHHYVKRMKTVLNLFLRHQVTVSINQITWKYYKSGQICLEFFVVKND